MHVRAGLACAFVALAALPAHAANERSYVAGQFALVLDGTESGFVHSTSGSDGAKKTLVISTDQPTAPLLGTVRTFLDGKASKKSLVLSTPAVIQKASDARLVDVRLPSYAGGPNDLALTFEVGATSSSPSLRATNDKAKPSGLKLASFRISLGDLPTNDATRLEAFAVKGKEGSAIPGAMSFDVPSRDAPAFLAWLKKSTARDGSIEYVSQAGEVLLGLKLGACSPSSAKIDGPVTHVAIQCARARAS